VDRIAGKARIEEVSPDAEFPDTSFVPPDTRYSETIRELRPYVSEPLTDFDGLLSAKSNPNLPKVLRQSIDKYLKERFQDELTRRATHRLHVRQPAMSALSPLVGWIRYGFCLMAIAAIAGFAVYPTATVTVLTGALLLYCMASLALKAALTFAALTSNERQPEIRSDVTPLVTILLPVHNEPLALVSLVAELTALDYPPEKLDLKFLVEESDVETRDALASLSLPDQFEVLIIPESHPQTKPKAMNYALPFVRGEIVGIYDAEDAPEPDQIRKAVNALAVADPATVCVQARLNHYKATETVLSRMVQAEYTLWFDILLKGLSRLRLPVPLGGTSLFIRTESLRAIDGWDPYNVTEDADLGLRLARRGWRAEIIDSTTWEEPPIKLDQWRGQRSRWIKGFMVTWLVHIRAPRSLIRELGWKNAVAINVMLLDGFVAFLLQPVFWIAILTWVFFGTSPWASMLTPSIASLTAWVFGVGQIIILVAAFIALNRRFGLRRAVWAPCLWIYWQFATRPAYRALREMFGRQTFWNKTQHGISRAAKRRREAALRSR